MYKTLSTNRKIVTIFHLKLGNVVFLTILIGLGINTSHAVITHNTANLSIPATVMLLKSIMLTSTAKAS